MRRYLRSCRWRGGWRDGRRLLERPQRKNSSVSAPVDLQPDRQRDLLAAHAQPRNHRIGFNRLAGRKLDFGRFDHKIAELGVEIDHLNHQRCGTMVGQTQTQLDSRLIAGVNRRRGWDAGVTLGWRRSTPVTSTAVTASMASSATTSAATKSAAKTTASAALAPFARTLRIVATGPMRTSAGQQGLDFNLTVKETAPCLHFGNGSVLASLIRPHCPCRRMPGTLASAGDDAESNQNQCKRAGNGVQRGVRGKRNCVHLLFDAFRGKKFPRRLQGAREQAPAPEPRQRNACPKPAAAMTTTHDGSLQTWRAAKAPIASAALRALVTPVVQTGL